MLPAILGLGGLTAKIIATAVIPRVVRAISQSFSATRPAEPCPSPAVEGISSAPETAPAPVLSGVSATRIKSRKWGYAGLWHHAPSGLDLATYRIFDAKNKRWISRDPLGEGTDRTLYSYAWNNPISNSDPSGLIPQTQADEVRGNPIRSGDLKPTPWQAKRLAKACRLNLKITGVVWWPAAVVDLGISAHNGEINMDGQLPDENTELPINILGLGAIFNSNRRTTTVNDLRGRIIHSEESMGARPDLQRLSDSELLNITNNNARNPMRINERTGGIMDGNSRARELLNRAGNPNSSIQGDTTVHYQVHQ